MKTSLNNQTNGQIGAHKSSGFGNVYLFTGRRMDDSTGLYYYRNRYQEPRSGRFVSRDPIGNQGLPNLYHYSKNNPVNLLDSFGLKDCKHRSGYVNDDDLSHAVAYSIGVSGAAGFLGGISGDSILTYVVNCCSGRFDYYQTIPVGPSMGGVLDASFGLKLEQTKIKFQRGCGPEVLSGYSFENNIGVGLFIFDFGITQAIPTDYGVNYRAKSKSFGLSYGLPIGFTWTYGFTYSIHLDGRPMTDKEFNDRCYVIPCSNCDPQFPLMYETNRCTSGRVQSTKENCDTPKPTPAGLPHKDIKAIEDYFKGLGKK